MFYIAIITIPSKGGGAELVQHHVDLCNKQLNTWMEEEVKSWDSCCELRVTCTLVISVRTKLYNIGIGSMRDFRI